MASVAVLVGGRMTEQTRRVGQLKAVGAARPVAAVLLAEHLIVASVAAAAGLMTGLLVAPLLSDAGAGLVGSPGAPALTLGTVGQVVAVALGVTLAATLVPAFRAARTSTASALADSPRPPRRWAMLIAISAWLPVPLLIGLRLVAPPATSRLPQRREYRDHGHGDRGGPRRSPCQRRGGPAPRLAANPSRRVSQVMAVLTVIVVCLAAVNAIVTGWATALDARHPSALSRALGATPRQVTAGLSVAQVLPALPGALIGVPLGIGLVSAVNKDGKHLTLPPLWWLVATVLVTVAAVAAITIVPAWLGTRRPVGEVLQSDLV